MDGWSRKTVYVLYNVNGSLWWRFTGPKVTERKYFSWRGRLLFRQSRIQTKAKSSTFKKWYRESGLDKTPAIVNRGQRDRHHSKKNEAAKISMVSCVQRVNGNYVRICMACGLESLAAYSVRAGSPVPTGFNLPTLSDLWPFRPVTRNPPFTNWW